MNVWVSSSAVGAAISNAAFALLTPFVHAVSSVAFLPSLVKFQR